MKLIGPVTLLCAVAVGACGDPAAPRPLTLEKADGDGQAVAARQAGSPLSVVVHDQEGRAVAGATVQWQAPSGFTIPGTTVSDSDGIASAGFSAPTTAGGYVIMARLAGSNSTVSFSVEVTAGPVASLAAVSGGGQQVPVGADAPQPLRVRATDQYGNPVPRQSVQWTVTAGGAGLRSPSALTDQSGVAAVEVTGVAAGTSIVSAIAGPHSVSLSVTGVVGAILVAEVFVPENYGIHDMFVRDGLAFVCAWNTGLIIYDVGNGIRGGRPWAPVEVSRIVTAGAGVSGGAQVHNAWWYHAPGGARRYVFVGQEGPGAIGSSSSGDVHVVDVSNLAEPREVATYRMPGAGSHNFWVDEANEILYAAFYNGGVVALNITGTLSGDLSSREIARIQPGGSGNTYVWGVMLSGGSLYANDMLSGFWQLRLAGSAFQVVAGGFNVPERFGSDLWVHGSYAYTGTWGSRAGRTGNAVKIWQLDTFGAPTLVDSITTAGIGTVSDIEVSGDGRMLMFSAENGAAAGVYWYSLTADPRRPSLITSIPVSTGVHTATFATIGGRRYAFAAKNPGAPALRIYDVQTISP